MLVDMLFLYFVCKFKLSKGVTEMYCTAGPAVDFQTEPGAHNAIISKNK